MTQPATATATSNRLLRPDGRYNVVRKGMERIRWKDLYLRLLVSSWPWLISIMVGIYVLLNAVFALLYLAIGDGIENARPGSFVDAFFFSVQTMATIGYGKMVPLGSAANILVTAEALIGLGGIAVATGLLFAKFSRPSARVMFSRYAVIAKRNGVQTLMFRVANERDSLIVEAEMHVVILTTETTAEGETMRRFQDLKLTRGRTAIFPMSWTVSHVIDETSPLFGITTEAMQKEEVELVCSLVGIEETFAQTVHARFSYAAQDIRHEHRFVDILSRLPDGTRAVDYTHFHETEEDSMPRRPTG
jgi:inward rectifier potassium channel